MLNSSHLGTLTTSGSSQSHGGHSQVDRLFSQLCSILLSLLKYPPMDAQSSATSHPPASSAAGRRQLRMTPVGFASLLFGIASALMLFGWVTFVIGIMMMPLVVGLAMFFYFMGVLSSLSVAGMGLLSGTGTVDHAYGERQDCSGHRSL